ncbi:spore coat protein CotJB [Orenia marismortui]|uniref:Spore coat protein JB n=1 Tax=Orenia marismortui TaxID=46469 RepID=A0A4R8GU39_9FIRM|nr:spore coat protein CotJB [Orenia marismortui]TDX45307.1 spore coat protein JB [Orenia marismortui]
MTREQLEMLKELMALDFYLVELSLFLNTHPNNRQALEDHNMIVREYKELKMDYVRRYGPLCTNCVSKYPWQYIETEWPWQINY